MAFIPVDIGTVKEVLGGNLTTKPKTLFGKGLAVFTGRNKNAREAEAAKAASGLNPSSVSSKSGVSGSLSFGQNQRLNLLPFSIIAGAVAAVYFIFKPKSRRRRR